MKKLSVRTDVSSSKIKELFALGHTQVAIANQLNCSQSLVSNRLKKMGFETSRREKRFPAKKKKQIFTKKMCSCCGFRPVPTKPVGGIKLTRLCNQCFRSAESDHENRDFATTITI
jgi:hypothetical protein